MMRQLVIAEAIKARRSATVRLALAAPVLLFLLNILTLFARGTINQTDPARLWRELLTFPWILWLGLFTPALIAAEAICLANVEHAGKHWKQLFTLSIPRWQLFAAKMVFCCALLAVSFVVFAVTSAGAVLAFSAARGLHLAAFLPAGEIAATAARAYLACWLLIVIHVWISVRYPGFATPAGVVFTAMLIGLMLANLNREIFGWWYPWTLPMNVLREGLYTTRNTLAPALFGALAGVLLAPVAAWDLGRRHGKV